MTAIVFETPDLIDIRAFTTMGISAKPASDAPIGKFGTGLKYAIAVLVRMGAEPIVWIGKDQYIFYKHPTTFRDKEFDLVMMRAKRWPQRLWRDHELPFTTEYGKFWKPWQAFRELEANTRDENGRTFYAGVAAVSGEVNVTKIVVSHPEFYEAWEKRDEVFLPGAASKLSSTHALEVFQGVCKFLYYRGMKVYELPQESMFTYNILKEIDLTEDRTIKYEFEAKQALGDFVAKSEDRAFVEKIVTAPEDTWEHSVDFAQWQRPKPSKVFQEVVRSKPAGLLPTVQAHHDYWEPPKREVVVAHVEQAHPTPWKIVADWIEDANGTNLFQKPYGYRGNWSRTAQMVIDAVNPKPEEEPVVEEKIDEPTEPPEFVQPNADDEVPF